MMPITHPDLKHPGAVLAGGGDLGRRMREIDWAATPLGPVEFWPQSLRTCIRIVLTSRQPMFVWWGEQLINLYNDAYVSILGGKHPAALGQPASVVWREIWDSVGPRASKAMRENVGTFDEALLLIMERNGYREETYYTFSYSPVPGDDGSPGGILCANSSDTQRIFGDRQQALLREVAARTSHARTVSSACELALEAFGTNRKDLPFALLYVVENGVATLACTAGIERDHPLALPTIAPGAEVAWPVAEVIAGAPIALRTLDDRSLPSGDWAEPPSEAIAIPVHAADMSLGAVLVIGRNPFRLLDDDYHRFLDLLAIQIGSAITSARTFEEERRRAEVLAELDRAKTTFFSNISHEFRTPLTLMLGPTEDALRTPEEALSGEALRAVHRNELRLLKLVNALLDFSRIEAGRLQATREPTDLPRFTRELASAFRSAIERAGLVFEVSVDSLRSAVSIDRAMWEKIVLNLLSNALKFTFEGRISLRLAERDGLIELAIADTGTGIPEHEIPRLFERFHRVEGARSRTHEGSGIGLALTHELVKLHHGSIDVDSAVGRGTVFTVRIPIATGVHAGDGVPADSGASATGMSAFVEEALRWLPDTPRSAPGMLDAEAVPAADRRFAPTFGSRIVLADDNADMRAYMQGLLAPFYKVEAVANGAEALAAAERATPELILSDVMMPELDGFGLLAAVRRDPALQSIPVVLLSARAGEESRIEGLDSGADDYIVKPFSARELLARVGGLLELRRMRRLRAAQFETLLNEAPLGVFLVDSMLRLRDANPTARAAMGGPPDLVGRDIEPLLRGIWREPHASEVLAQFRRTLETGEPCVVPETSEEHRDRRRTEYYEWQISRIPLPDGQNGVVCYFRDISQHVKARMQLETADRQKDEFLAMLAHELRNPLAPIRNAGEVLSRLDLREPRAEQAVGVVQRQITTLTRLVDDLLDVSRITRGRVELQMKPVQLSDVVSQAVEMVEPLVKEKRQRLSTTTYRALRVHGDPARLVQCVANVLTNAVKYT
ncbi:MAG TPA: histidine kinase dimerization/phospho-acceptor domain-containing protein, partial [Kofleriaceae bacterium]|nr:histidine kinase dimerization/phospho-acceptor domain-containing protein [Kofleriaceae bacterium]